MTYARMCLYEVPILISAITMGYLIKGVDSVWSLEMTSSSGGGHRSQFGPDASTSRVIEQHQSTAQQRKIVFECFTLAKARTNIDPKLQVQSETKLNTFSAEIQACLKARKYFSTMPSTRTGADEQ
jgi:hypothetical protein